MGAMGGSGGADLNYTDDDLDSYSTIWDGEVTDSGKKDHKAGSRSPEKYQ